MSQVNITEVRASLAEILARVADGHEVTITRHGRPVAVIVRPDTLRHRRAEEAFAEAERLGQLLDEARDTPQARVPSLPRGYADDLVAQIRRDRDRSRRP